MASCRQLEGTTHSAHSRRGFEAQTILGGTELAMKMFGTKFLHLLNKDSEKLFPAWHHSYKVTNVAKHFLLSYGRLLWNKPTLYKQRRAVNFIVLYTDNYTFCHVHLFRGMTRNRRKRNDTHPIMLPYRPCQENVTFSSRYTSRTGYVTRLPQQPLRTSLFKTCRYLRGAPLFREPHYSQKRLAKAEI